MHELFGLFAMCAQNNNLNETTTEVNKTDKIALL